LLLKEALRAARRVVRRLRLPAGAADDIAAEAVRRVLVAVRADAPVDDRLAGAWIAGVVRNVAAEELRRMRRHAEPMPGRDEASRRQPGKRAGLLDRLRRLEGDEPWIGAEDRPLLEDLLGGAPERDVARRQSVSRSTLRRRMEALLRLAKVPPSVRALAALDGMAAATLSSEGQRIVALRRAGATYADIARDLGISTNAARLRLRRILRRFARPPPVPRS